jgi:hypothetical protein
MIAHFPEPYPGELLYSVCARFAERMQYPTLSATMRELFGDRTAVAAIELPNQLDSLIARLPLGHRYSSDILIDRHTLFPVYAAFVREENYQRLREMMKSSGVRTTQLVSGMNACRVPSPGALRCCPACDIENQRRYGETYWNRVHQIPGIEVCPFHSVFLEETNVLRRKQEIRHNFVAAQRAERPCVPRKLDLSKQEHVVMLKLAKLAAEILDLPPSIEFRRNLRDRYRAALREKGFTARKGRLCVIEAKRDLLAFCSTETLSRLHCQLPESNTYSGWLGGLVHSKQQSIAPIRHLLFMAWLGLPLTSYLNAEPVVDPLLKTFPCLNSVCAQFQKQVCNRIEFRDSNHVSALQVFRCPHCSHASSRNEEATEIVRVIDFGPLWAEKLKRLWSDKTTSIRDIAHQLDADPTTVRRRAVALGLLFPRYFPSANPAVAPKTVRTSPPVLRRESYKTRWLSLREKGNLKATKKLRRLHAALYIWLHKHEPEWLRANSLRGNRRVYHKEIVNWHDRDEELAAGVPAAVARIKSRISNPRRVSFTRIGRELGSLAMIQARKAKLPKTIQAISAAEETREAFGLRRLQNAVTHFLNIRYVPNWSELTKKAGINSNLFRSPVIGSAVRSALTEIEMVVLNRAAAQAA